MTYPKWVPRGDGQQILCHSEDEEAQAAIEPAAPVEPPESEQISEPVKNRGGRPRKVQ